MKRLTEWKDESWAKRGVEFLVWAPGWETPSIAQKGDDDDWYCPNTGCELTPRPTHYALLPAPPLNVN